MSNAKIILLERVEKLGEIGDTVDVKPGFARNFLLPQGKALRATKDNIAYFEAQKKNLVELNNKKKTEAEKRVKSLKGVTADLIRNASESGQMYGSVNSRDIAESLKTFEKNVTKSEVAVNQNFKIIGLYPVTIQLHPEVQVEVTINIARSEEEAKIQRETGKALITVEDDEPEVDNQSDMKSEDQKSIPSKDMATTEAETISEKADPIQTDK